MGAIYLAGLRRALQRWPIALLLYAASLIAGLLFVAAAWFWLTTALDKSLATRTLLTHLDTNVFIDLFINHRASLRMLLFTGGIVLVVFSLLWVWLNAITVVAVGENVSFSECARRGREWYPTFLGLWVLANLLHVLSALGVFGLGRTLIRWTAESPAAMTFYWIVGGCVVLGAVVLFFLTTVHDHARIHSVATGSGATRSYGWALGFVAGREPRALPLALLVLLTGAVLWAGYQTVALLIPVDRASGVTLSLLWGQMLLVVRMLVRVWMFAAETDLQNVSESAPQQPQ